VQYDYSCTYGFNVQISGSANRYMITNSHCVQPIGTFGGLIGAVVAQPDNQTSSRVGYVVLNPQNFTGYPCPADHQCRYSDAALIHASSLSQSNWDLGGLSRPENRFLGPGSDGSIQIDSSEPRISLAGQSVFFIGDILDKIGSTTGWTAGEVTATCEFHVEAPGSPFGRICDGVVAAGANHGDSGSPVFWTSPTGVNYLMGILWGGAGATESENSYEFWFSQWENIKADLSPYQNMYVN